LEVRSLGVDLALDDFGTSYSSLSYLRSFPFERIKLDRSFVAGADEPRTASVVRAVVGLARALVNQLRIGSGHP
jgi:EAL domain-containing protein (putative c-di-GMP-specific phosphodiesterase class I)